MINNGGSGERELGLNLSFSIYHLMLLDKLLNFFVLQIPHLYMGIITALVRNPFGCK